MFICTAVTLEFKMTHSIGTVNENAVKDWAKVTEGFDERKEAYRFFQVRETNKRVQAIRMANKRKYKS